jgi:putative SOS response-associated peptidase YedK
MCNRAATYDEKEAAVHLKDLNVMPYPAFFQVSAFEHPTLPVIKMDAPDTVQPVQWGMKPFWLEPGTPFPVLQKEEGQTINTQAETALKWLPKFGHLKKQEKCLTILKGFYEYRWEDEKGKMKTPFFIYMPDNEPLAIPSLLWTWVNDETGEVIETMSLLTTKANERMSYIHNQKKRMPAVIDRAEWNQWLDPTVKYKAPSPYKDGVLRDHAVANFLKKGMNQNCPEVQQPISPTHVQEGLF